MLLLLLLSRLIELVRTKGLKRACYLDIWALSLCCHLHLQPFVSQKFPDITHVPTLLIRVPSPSAQRSAPSSECKYAENNQETTSNCFCELDKISSTDQLSLTHKRKEQAGLLGCTQLVLKLKKISLNHHPCQRSFLAASEDSVLSTEQDCSGSKRKWETQVTPPHCCWPSSHCWGH